MKRKRYTDEQIAYALRQAEAGTPIKEVCRKLGVSEQTFYTWRRKFAGMGDDPVLRRRLRELAAARPRFGYRRLCVLLRREGWLVNQKRVYRIYREEGLEVRTKKRRRKRASHIRLLLPPAQRPNERWSMDFVTDRLENGRLFRILTVLDQFSRECPLLEPGVSMTGKTVARALERLSFARPLPQVILRTSMPASSSGCFAPSCFAFSWARA